MDNDNNKFVSSTFTGSEFAIEAAAMTGAGETMDAGFFNKTLPAGYRFAPTDEELIDYLNMKLSGKRLPTDQIIEVDLYAYDPQDLTGAYKLYREKEWYFFTPREKKYPNGVRPSRGTSDGFWKLTGTETHIPRNGHTIGVRTGLDFYKGKRRGGKRTDWKMHEYTLEKPSDRDRTVAANSGMQLDKWVLCKIYKNTRSARRGDDDDDDEAPEGGDDDDDEGREVAGVVPREDANSEDGTQLIEAMSSSNPAALQSTTNNNNNDFEEDENYYAEIMALCGTESPPNFDMGLSSTAGSVVIDEPELQPSDNNFPTEM